MKTVFINVLCSAGDPYPELAKCSQATWDSVPVPGMDSAYFFDREYCGTLPRSIRLKGDGALVSCAIRVMESLEWCLARGPWDYMARINASCYVRKPKLLEYCQHLPETGLFLGVKAPGPGGRYFMWGGGQFIFSRDVVTALVKHRAKLPPGEMEDVALSRIADAAGVALNGTGHACSLNRKPDHWFCLWYNLGKQGGFDFGLEDYAALDRPETSHFIRVKQDCRRHEDLALMRALHKHGI